MTRDGCERLHELAPELALGIADGEERAWALDHLAGCPDCRVRVERLAALADELLALGPVAEPPAGFEARVAEAIASSSRARRARPSGWRRLALPAVAALAAAACGAAAMWIALDDDRDLANSYRETLAVANGEYFDAAPLELPCEQRAGYVYGYQGRASWVLAVVYDGVPDGRYELELVTADGRKFPLRELEVADGRGSSGAVTPVDFSELAQVRLLDEGGREVAESDVGD
jgi:Putative zinc-finger